MSPHHERQGCLVPYHGRYPSEPVCERHKTKRQYLQHQNKITERLCIAESLDTICSPMPYQREGGGARFHLSKRLNKRFTFATANNLTTMVSRNSAVLPPHIDTTDDLAGTASCV